MKSLIVLLLFLSPQFYLPYQNLEHTNNKNILATQNQKSFNHDLWHQLLQKHVDNTGIVDYKGFKNDKEQLSTYIQQLSKNTPKSNWKHEEKLAYWINAYNALTVDLIIKHYPVESIKDIKHPWKQNLWTLGNDIYNLHDIEHKILRKMDEPRIHFAIVCAAKSCPKLQNTAYTASNLELQLRRATQDFINDASKNDISENDLELSKIFQWFTNDFKQHGSLIDFLNQYASVSISAKAKIRYKPYIWELND